MGDLVSIYSGIMYCEVFGKFGSNVLSVFADNHASRTHLDIAGMAFGGDKFAKTKYGTAHGVHSIINYG
jgi:leucyl aminopeptidase